jgi:hypothetical protein
MANKLAAGLPGLTTEEVEALIAIGQKKRALPTGPLLY